MLPATSALVLPVSAKSSDITGEFAQPPGARAPEGALRHARTREWTREQFTRDVSPLLPTVYRLCLALADNASTAEDLLQSALVRAYVHRESFREEGALAAWLCCIVRNEHTEIVRQTARRRGLIRSALERFGQLFEDWSGAPDAGPELSLSIAEEAEDVLSALQELPEQYRTAVWMCDVEEMSYQQASEALGIPIGTVKSRHARGRAKLRAALARRRARENV